MFIKNIIQFSFDHQITDLAEAIVHFMFLDLVEPTMHTKLNYLIYEIIYQKSTYQGELESEEDFGTYEQKFKLEIFKELTRSLEAKQCAQAMFVVKYERLDTSFLNQFDISIFYTGESVRVEEVSEVSSAQSTLASANGKKQEDPEEEKNGQIIKIAESEFVNITISEPKTSTRTKSRGFGLFGGSKTKDKDEKGAQDGSKSGSIQDLAGEAGQKSNRARLQSFTNVLKSGKKQKEEAEPGSNDSTHAGEQSSTAERDSEFQPNQSRRDSKMSSTSRPNYASAQAISIRGYIIDTIDALADSLCTKVPSIPMPIRIYCKALYDVKKK